MADHARHCLLLMRQLGIERAHIVGHSSSVAVALQLALDSPEAVQTVVSMDAARPAPPTDQRITYGQDPSQFGDLRWPAGPGPYPLAVVLHGGWWRSEVTLDYLGHVCAALTAEGIATQTRGSCTCALRVIQMDLSGAGRVV